MGIGDQLMAAGEAKRMHAKRGKPVCICDRQGLPQWFPVWEGIPYIAKRRTGGSTMILNGSGVRPYIAGKTAERWSWKAYRPTPADYRVSAAEARYAAPFKGCVMLEPNVKAQSHRNKAWPFERWQDLADKLEDCGFHCLQCVQPGAPMLAGVQVVVTQDIRTAIGILASAQLFIGTEGALHHAAAAVGTPAVVLWSEFISPDVTGYDTQTNLRHAGNSCGSRLPCAGCEASMRAIEVDEVFAAARDTINAKETA